MFLGNPEYLQLEPILGEKWRRFWFLQPQSVNKVHVQNGPHLLSVLFIPHGKVLECYEMSLKLTPLIQKVPYIHIHTYIHTYNRLLYSAISDDHSAQNKIKYTTKTSNLTTLNLKLKK